MANKLVHAGYPCDTCGATSEDNEASHLACDFCSHIGCQDCIENHVLETHEEELYDGTEDWANISEDDC